MSFELGMKKLYVLLLMLLPVVLYGQTNDSLKQIDSVKTTIIAKPTDIAVQKEVGKVIVEKKSDSTNTKNYEMSVSYTPEYSYRTLKANDDEASKLIKEIRDTLDVAKFGYSAGISLIYHPRKKLGIEAGVFFSDKGEKTKKNTMESLPFGQEAARYSYNFHYYYLTIPVKADYYFLTGKLKVYITAGVSANVLLVQKTTLIITHANSTERTTTDTDNGFNRINMSVMGGFGLIYPITNKMNLKLEPIYSRSITSIINAPVKEYLYSIGVNVGLMFTPHFNCTPKPTEPIPNK